VKNAVYAADQLNIPYTIALCTHNKEDKDYKKIYTELRSISSDDKILTAIIFPTRKFGEKNDIPPLRVTHVPPKPACSAASSPIIFPDGRVIACIGPLIKIKNNHLLNLGNVNHKSLSDIFDLAQQNPLLHSLRIWGPRKIISYIQGSDAEGQLPDNYVMDSACPTCFDLFNNEELSLFLSDLYNDNEFKMLVAYARVHYLQEFQSIEYLYRQGLIK
jgi:hypothetical protein